MSAKLKANQAHWLGVLLVAGCLGGVRESWTVFAIALIALVIAAICAGDIRW